MSSQKDFFDDSFESNKKKVIKKRISSTFDLAMVGQEYEYSYFWIILFDWNVDVEMPFVVYKLSQFTDSDIKPTWISNNLGVSSRIKKIKNLSLFPGGTYSLFAKIEIGSFFVILMF